MLRQKEGKELMMKTRHASLDLPDEIPLDPTPLETVKNKSKQSGGGDIWWNKFANFGEVLKSKNNTNNDSKKSKTQTTLDYFLKPKNKSEPKPISSNNQNSRIRENGRPSALQKQMSVGSYPILLNIPEETTITRDRPATVCSEKPAVEHKATLGLNLERPRKKLSFREPEITGFARQKSVIGSETLPRKNIKPFNTPQLHRSNLQNGGFTKWASYEDLDLEVF